MYQWSLLGHIHHPLILVQLPFLWHFPLFHSTLGSPSCNAQPLHIYTSFVSCCCCDSLILHRCWCRVWEPTLLNKVAISATISTIDVMITALITLWTTPCILSRGGSLDCYYCNYIHLYCFMLLFWWLPSPSLRIPSKFPLLTPRLWEISLLDHGVMTYLLVR